MIPVSSAIQAATKAEEAENHQGASGEELGWTNRRQQTETAAG
jgi:hypothetical protein